MHRKSEHTQGNGSRALGIGALLGGMTAYLFDPQSGRKRRAETRDRMMALMRRGGRRAERAGRGIGARAYGMSQKAQHRHEVPKDFDDVTLARKVETELFRPPDVPKEKIAVNAANGVVQLRGEADSPEMIRDLVDRARRVQGVRGVESLLHLPHMDAPMHQ